MCKKRRLGYSSISGCTTVLIWSLEWKIRSCCSYVGGDPDDPKVRHPQDSSSLWQSDSSSLRFRLSFMLRKDPDDAQDEQDDWTLARAVQRRWIDEANHHFTWTDQRRHKVDPNEVVRWSRWRGRQPFCQWCSGQVIAKGLEVEDVERATAHDIAWSSNDVDEEAWRGARPGECIIYLA